MKLDIVTHDAPEFVAFQFRRTSGRETRPKTQDRLFRGGAAGGAQRHVCKHSLRKP